MKIVVALDSSAHSQNALNFAVKILKSLKDSSLLAINVVALNPTTKLPFLDHMQDSANIDIEELADVEKLKLEQILKKLPIEYEFKQIEGEGNGGEIFYSYLKEVGPDLVVVGTSQKTGLEKYFGLK